MSSSLVYEGDLNLNASELRVIDSYDHDSIYPATVEATVKYLREEESTNDAEMGM